MKVRIERNEVEPILGQLRTLSSLNANFKHAVASNKKLLEAELRKMEKAVKPPDGYWKYVERHSISLEKAYDNKDKHNKMRKEYTEKTEKIIEEQKRRIGELKNSLNEEIEMDFYPVNIHDCPQMSESQKKVVTMFVAPETKKK